MNIEVAIAVVREMVDSFLQLYYKEKEEKQQELYYAQYITAQDILWAITDGAEGND